MHSKLEKLNLSIETLFGVPHGIGQIALHLNIKKKGQLMNEVNTL